MEGHCGWRQDPGESRGRADGKQMADREMTGKGKRKMVRGKING